MTGQIKTRVCSVCNKEKPLEEFHIHAYGYLKDKCHECERVTERLRWRRKHPPSITLEDVT